MTATLEETPLVLNDEARALLFDAHTAYTFSDEPISDAQIAAIYDLVKYAPSALNAQPLRVILVRGTDAKERLLTHMADGNRPKTATAPLTAILAADTNFHDHLDRVFPVYPGARDMFLDDDTRTNVAVAQAWLQTGYFLLGIRAAGLAAGPMTGFDAAGVDRDLLDGTGLKSIAVVNIGHPGENAFYPRNPRLEADEVITVM